MRRAARVFKILLVLACVGIYGYSAVGTNRGQVHSVSIDVGRPLAIVWPFETAIVGDEGEKGLRIGANIGMGWRGEAGGEASYRFYIPEAGKYHIWAYCLWFDECANAVFAQIDNLEKAIIGNDPMYNQWHWVRGFDVRLEKGTHTIVLSNHSDHISLQKVFLTNSSFATPEDCGPIFADIFYDGFDGCDEGNFGNWRAVQGKWGVRNPDEPLRFEQNILTRRTKDDSFIVYRGDGWSDYSFNIAVRSEVSGSGATNGAIGLCFGLEDESRYHQVTFKCAGQADVAVMELARRTPQEIKILASSQISWKHGKWHQVEIFLNQGEIAVKVDDSEHLRIAVEYEVIGGIGLRLEGGIDAYFDDIHIREVSETKS